VLLALELAQAGTTTAIKPAPTSATTERPIRCINMG
jgi:hypothetical protein